MVLKDNFFGMLLVRHLHAGEQCVGRDPLLPVPTRPCLLFKQAIQEKSCGLILQRTQQQCERVTSYLHGWNVP